MPFDIDSLRRDLKPGGPIVQQWGANLRTARTAAGFTMTELAARAGTTIATVSRVEAGTLPAGDAIRTALADALGVPAHDIWAQPDLAEYQQKGV